jgi:hypothetical protein
MTQPNKLPSNSPSPPSSSSALLVALQNGHSSIWLSTWRDYVAQQLARHAIEQIDVVTGRIHDRLAELDDAMARSRLVPGDEKAQTACADELILRRHELNDILETAGCHRQSARQLRATLLDHGVIGSLLNSPTSVTEIAQIDLTRVWEVIGHAISSRVHSMETSGSPEVEPLVHNRLLLARLFQTCRLRSARQLAAHVNTLMVGLHGPRSALVAIVERVTGNGIEDPALPSPPPHDTAWALATAGLSDLLAAVAYEAVEIPKRHGFMHRLVNVNERRAIPRSVQHLITPDKLVEYRSRSYRQYESTLLCYGVLSAYEQLLRGLAVRTGVDHMKGSPYPAPVMDWVTDKRLRLSQAILSDVRVLFDSSGPNIRNRAMHAGLLEIESKRLDVTLGLPNPALTAAPMNTANDTLIPENMLAICMARLTALDQYALSVGLERADVAWADTIWLTTEERKFGNAIKCDVLEDEEIAVAWQQELSDFVLVSMPTFSVYWKMAWTGWLKKHIVHDSVLAFLAWGVIFEGLYRLTLQVLGFEVLQRSPVGANGRMFQYRSIDARATGLCRQAVLEALTEELEPHERPNAVRTVLLAVKVRNALAHGGVLDHDEMDHLAGGHLFIKSIQLLMAVTLHRMTRVRAYFRYVDRAACEPSDPIGDWLVAEPQTLKMMHGLADARRRLFG